MVTGRPLPPLELSPSDRERLESMAKSRSLSHGLVRRAEISLLAAEGWPNEAVAAAVGVTRATVGKWRRRFLENGLPGLHDELRSGAPRSSTDEQVAEVVYKTLKTKPKDETQWSVRSMGEETGLTKDAVHRIWRTYGLQPHRHKHFKLSTDPFFVDKVRDIVGLYLNPPEHALVLCVDESRIQALERSQPMLPLGLGYVEGITHDYKRHGTTTLFAALDVATGEVMTQCKPRHRHQEFLQFLRHIEAHVPADLDIHLVVDNYATHKHAKVKRWLARRPRFHVHYTPTYASWLNQVEIWFNILTRQAVRRDSFRKVSELIERIERYTAKWNANAHYGRFHPRENQETLRTNLCDTTLGVIARTRQYRPRVSDLNQWLRVEVTYTDDYTDDFGGHRVSATTSRAVGPGPPCAPANLKAAPGDGQVTLTWEAGCNNGGTIARYQYRRPEAVKWVRVPGDGSARRQQVTGLTNGEAHTFEVRARNRQGWGPAAQATATPAAAESPPPQPPLTVTYGASSYSAQEGGEAATVTVRLSASASEALRIPIAVNPRSGDFTVAGLTDGGLSFSSGAERQTFTITANQDDDWDDEEVTLGFGTPLPEGVSAGDPARATVTLFDDDDAPGEVTVRPATAQVGTELTATLSDADEVAEVTGWQWHRRASDQAAWTAISGATAAAYTPVSADAGQYLQATVRYTDGHGPDKSAESAAIGPVQATGPTERTVWFGKESYEASEGGAAETVTVRLSRAVSSGLRIPISVDPRSGPFTLAGLGTDTTLTIASGISGTFTIRADQDADRVDETVALGFRDLPSGVVAGTPSSATVTLTDDDELLIMRASDTTFAENGTGVVAAYTATDANGGHTVAWSIHADKQRPANADSTHFAMGSRNGRLTFRATPDFAAPDDTGHDNVYLVTVQATDNGNPPDFTLHDVSVTVTNEDEPGQVEFVSTRPQVNVQLTAAVTDPDGNVVVQTQQWERQDGAGGWEAVDRSSGRGHDPPSTYPGQATFWPIADDVGKKLRVTVAYLNGESADDEDTKPVQSGETHPVVTDFVRRLKITGAADTTFAERTTGVVAPYRALYTDGQEATSVTWTLSGPDAKRDTLVIDGDDGELRFTTEPDYENPTDANLDTVYEVTVEATDAGPPAMDTTLAVSVRVTNEDDPGVVVLTTTEPRVGNPLTAVLTDQDEGVTGVHWTWLMLQPGRDSDDPRSTGSVAPTYTPVSSDAGLVLRARADYTDAHGSGKVASSSDSEPVDPRRLTVSFGSSSYEAVEGGSAETITVNMSPAADRFVRIPITFNPTSGDYSLGGLGSGRTLTFSNGDASQTFTVTDNRDSDRDDETVSLGFGTLPPEVRAGSPASAAVTLADGAPSPPTDLRLRPASPQGHTRLTVSWTPPPEAVSGYEYRIQGSGSPPSAAAIPATISGLEPGTGYRVQVRARNRYGSSGWASGSGRTNANRRPDIAGPGEESVPENTTSVADYTKSDPDGDATRWLALGGTHADWFDFSAGSLRFRRAPDYERDPHSYRVTVRATDGYDVREHAVTVTITDVPPPEAPTASLSVPSSNGHERLDVSWTEPASESPITGYELEYCFYTSRDDGGPSSQDPPSDPGGTEEEERSPGTCSTRPESGNSAVLADLYDNTLYGVRVRATSGEGPGSWSNRAPEISGETAPSVAENSRSVADYTNPTRTAMRPAGWSWKARMRTGSISRQAPCASGGRPTTSAIPTATRSRCGPRMERPHRLPGDGERDRCC